MACAQGCGGTGCGCDHSSRPSSHGAAVAAPTRATRSSAHPPATWTPRRIPHTRANPDGTEHIRPYKPWMDCGPAQPILKEGEAPDDDELRELWDSHPEVKALVRKDRLNLLLRRRARNARSSATLGEELRAPKHRPAPWHGPPSPVTDLEIPAWSGCGLPVRRSSGCAWKLQDYVARLWDPYHISCADVLAGTGTPEERDLGWWLHTSSTYTLRVNGVSRMYFQNGTIKTLCDAAGVAWPLADATSKDNKFAYTYDDPTYRQRSPLDSPSITEWWRAESGVDYNEDKIPDVTELCFSSEFVSFLDSDQDGNFRIWAPRLMPSSATQCWADATVAHDGFTATGRIFRAGWNSTDIRCSGDSTVYRDVSVVYLPSLQLYAMFAVECVSPTGFVEGSGECSICTPDASGTCMDAGVTPTTRYVFFLSRNPNFQNSVSAVAGPFDALPKTLQPDTSTGEWFGVPQTLKDPDERVLLMIFANRTSRSSTGVVYSCGIDAFEMYSLMLIFRLPGAWTSPFDHALTLQVAGATPSSGGTPKIADPHLIFAPDGMLHLFFSNSLNVGAAAVLDVVSHASAYTTYNSDIMMAYVEGGDATSASISSWMVGTYAMAACDPLCLPRLLTGTCSTSSLIDLVNDPEVYEDPTETLRMNFLCQPLNGLVYATADPDEVYL